MNIKVAKFGGTSLADAHQFRKVQAIVESDPQRRFVVPSAPGKRTADDRKITDLLYLCHAHAQQKLPFDELYPKGLLQLVLREQAVGHWQSCL